MNVRQIVGVAISLIIVAAILPVAFTTFFETQTTGWPSAVASLWNLIPIMAIIALVLGFISYATKKVK